MNNLITAEEILSFKDKVPEIDSEIFDRVHTYIYADGTDKSIEKLRSLPIGYQTIFDTLVIEGEIYNGGFYQYFSNSAAGEHHAQGIEAFKRVGAIKVAALLEEVFELILKQSVSFRTSYQIDGIQEAFNRANELGSEIDLKSMDDRFYSIIDTDENLNKLRVAYIFNNLSDF